MIHARSLARTFVTKRGKEKTEVKAVSGVDVDVDKGEIVGFLGPNGAGKTTTLRMLTTLLKPTSGTATVAGYDLLTEPVKVRQSIGYVSQSGAASGEARAGEEIVDHGLLYGIDKARATARAQELMEQLDLPGMWTRQAKTLSGGQRRRLDIAMGLVHDPTLVFLDEPTTGLDPQARANLWTHISGLRTERGSTVFLTTHYLDEADALCDRILVIDHGTIVAADTPNALKDQVSGDLVEVIITDPARVGEVSTMLGAIGSDLTVDGLTISSRVRGAGGRLPDLLRALDGAGIVIDGIEVRRPTLDDVFLNLTGRSLRETEA